MLMKHIQNFFFSFFLNTAEFFINENANRQNKNSKIFFLNRNYYICYHENGNCYKNYETKNILNGLFMKFQTFFFNIISYLIS